MDQHVIIEFVPNPAAAGRVMTDTELLQRAMDLAKAIADENHQLRKAILGIKSTDQEFSHALNSAIELASAPVPYCLADFFPALRVRSDQ